MKNVIFLFLFLMFSGSAISQWTEQFTNNYKPLLSVSAVNDNIVWACGDSGTVIMSTNSGFNWINASSNIPRNYRLHNIFALNESEAFVAAVNDSSGTKIFKTHDQGNSWISVFSRTNGSINAIWMKSETEGLAVGNPVNNIWTIIKTSDAGYSWVPVKTNLMQSGSENGYNNSLFVKGDFVWFGTNNSRVYISSDGGNTYSAKSLIESSIYSIWFNEGHGLISGKRAFKSSDNGQMWNQVSLPGTSAIFGVTGRGSEYWAVRISNPNIFYSSDNGESFLGVYNLTNTFYNHIQASRSGILKVWAVRRSGSVVMYSNPNSVQLISSVTPLKFSLDQNFPNPFNPSTTIKLSVPVSSDVKLIVYDLLGREIETLINEKLNSGIYSIQFDAVKLSSGIYFYRLYGSGFLETKKMLKID